MENQGKEESNKNSIKNVEDIKDETKKEINDKTKDKTKDKAKVEIKDEPKNEIIDDHKDEIRNEPKDEIIDEPRDEIRNEPKDEIIDEPKDEIKDEPKNEEKEENKEDTKIKGSYRKLQIESCKNVINYTVNQKSDKDNDIISNSNNNLDFDIQIMGERVNNVDGEYNSENNLFNLSTLFRDYINTHGIRRTKRQRSIYRIRNLRTNSINEKESDIDKENDTINLYNIIKDRLTEVKEDTLHYLDKTKQKLESKYNYLIKKINEFLIEKEKQISILLG